MVRTQIILEENQHHQLVEIARQQNRSLSDLVREFLDDQVRIYKKRQLSRAAEQLRQDYLEDGELTALSTLNGESLDEAG